MARPALLEHRFPPPLLMVGALLAQRRLPCRPGGAPRGVLAGGIVLGSLALAAQAGHLFRAHGTTVTPLAPGRASDLVTDGSYTLTRNPMYVAMAGVLLAHAVHRGHPVQLVPLAAWVGFIDRFQVEPEERALAELFGAEYEAYRRRVRRWL